MYCTLCICRERTIKWAPSRHLAAEAEMRLDKSVAPVDRTCLEEALDQFCVTVDT